MSRLLLEQVFRLDELPPHEKAVLVYLAFRAGDDGRNIYPSLDSICLAVGHQRRWVRQLLTNLIKKGYIVPVARTGGRGNSSIFYIPVEGGLIRPMPEEKRKGRHLREVTEEFVEILNEEDSDIDKKIRDLEKRISSRSNRLRQLQNTGAAHDEIEFQKGLLEEAEEELNLLYKSKERKHAV